MALAPVRRVLPNGLTVLVQENHTTPAVSSIVEVAGGALADPPGEEGTAALTARVLDRGADGLAPDAVADLLDARGAALAVNAGRHRLALTCTCLAEDAAEVLSVAARLVMTPAFPAGDVEVRRNELITELREAEDDPAAVAVDGMMAALYAGHPYGRPTQGQVKTVEGLTRSHLTAFHRRCAAPGATTVVAVGSLPADEMLGIVERAFGAWTVPASDPAPVPPPPPAGPRRLLARPMPDKAQADIAYGLIGIARPDPDYEAALVMNHALGQHAIGGRLGDSIRERQGMAYYVFSRLQAHLGAGPLLIRAGVSAANVERAIASIDGILDTVARDGFTTRELAEARQYLIGSMPRRLESNGSVAAFLAEVECFGLGLDYDRHYAGRIAAVSDEAIHAVARRLLDPSRATIVVAGPWTGPAAPFGVAG
jgi:zinc protease